MAQLASAGPVPLCQICSQPIARRIRKSRDSGRCCSRACGFEMMRRERSASRADRLARLAEIRKAICGEDAPRELRGTMRWNAPELDHIIPLSAGGSHTYDNVACAHRSCNLDKGDALPPGWAEPQRVWVHRGSGGIA